MKDNYFELSVQTDSFKDEIENFLIERFNNGIEEKENTLILRSENNFESLIEELKKYVSALEEIFNTKISLNINVEKKSNIDWIENYKKSIKPIEIDGFYIHPSWYENKNDKENIIIDPALAFGSGHHETTRSCVKAINKYVKKGNTFLDVGCGSGILSIVAAKKGAVVNLCDTDELAVKSAKENFESNNVEFNKIWVGSAGDTDEKYDVVVANIIADILIFIANDLKKRVNGYLILSGIINKYKNKVLEKYKEFELIEEIFENEWVTLILKNVE
ncbi:50S ribosomal protein L11 methyltransferase [Lebetimonas sp. JH292]|uniref:50S ribosomal protein L11 methyltransferase n=1 Tax=Lebetimonas sp. JH292 TaxID=990068 RepID=UPI0004656A5E|nr:50S ribosomal protein L11 methyltransferase [Lebetimonas sp. JH292]